MKNWQWWLIGIAAIGLFTLANYKTILQKFLPVWEGFSAKPYWDYQQWSWGYGTRVPGSTNNSGINPGGTITREKAIQDALAHVSGDYQYLKQLITRDLNPGQWAALLSFSYNLGKGNADNLVNNINSGNDDALQTQWKKYVYAGGEVLPQLIERRNAEWDLWKT